GRAGARRNGAARPRRRGVSLPALPRLLHGRAPAARGGGLRRPQAGGRGALGGEHRGARGPAHRRARGGARRRLAPGLRPRPERRPEAPRRAKRSELQEELFAEDTYRLPALNLLDPPVRTTQPLDEAALHASSRILETKLADFQVSGKVVAVRPGPVITTFEFEPAPGVKVNRIVTLADDLSMALPALSVRLLAPIPGKPVVGIEVSNPRREKVFIRELLESVEYEHADSKLALALGKDTTGNVVVADLARMPHLLVAGATGTGKSVS